MASDVLPDPRLVASTEISVESRSSDTDRIDESSPSPDAPPPSSKYLKTNLFNSIQWSADGTTLLASSDDNILRAFILPPDLLTSPTLHKLSPYTTHTLPTPSNATIVHPSFSLSNPNSCLYLTSLTSLPIRLLSPFIPGILSSYPLINPLTERYISPHSLLFSTQSPNHFLAGSDSLISLFDITRDGEGPVLNLPTIPSKRRKLVGGGVGMKGIVSTMCLSNEGVLAAGTFTRWIGLYDSYGAGGTISLFSLGNDNNLTTHHSSSSSSSGAGITSLSWSSCSKYLIIAERGSDGISIWDIRMSGRRVSWLSGRNARTMQRMSVEVVGGDVWAGGTDGNVRVWKGIGSKEGDVGPDRVVEMHGDTVSNVRMHPFAEVLATCSGSRHELNPADDDTENDVESDDTSEHDGSRRNAKADRRSNTRDNSLKVWAL